MKRISYTILLITSLALLVKCKKHPLSETFYSITVENNSSEKVHFYMYDEFSEKQYPDTTLPLSKVPAKGVLANKKFHVDKREPWGKEIDDLVHDTLSIYFFAEHTFQDSSWEVVSSEYSVLLRYDLSLNDLERINYIIPYPSNETMKGIRMFVD